MSKKMLINASHPEENRVAIVVDGILSELDIEIAGQEQTKGNIYKAVVVRVETGLQAAFIDYGAEKLGFLQIGEIHPSYYPPKEEGKDRPRITDLLRRGQEILVQIVKEERGNKGAALTTFLSLPGRYMVLMPDSTTKGVSRKIMDDSERKSLKKTMAELDLPEQMGYIVRTAGIGKDKEELKRDFDYLVRLYEGINARKDQVKAPSQLYQESNLVIRSIRDYFTTDMDEVLIDDARIFQEAKDFFALVMPELGHLVKRHRERRPIFSRYQIEEQIDGLAKNQTALPSGGSIVIDQTEALVAIDVNSGKMSSESGIEATALRTNLEAAAEVGRQLRLRDLGGLIVIDFIDMRDRKNVREVEIALKKALKNDKAKVSVGRISQFGLMEMSRQRLKPVLSVGAFHTCPHCQGIGKVKSVEAQAINFLRQAHTAASKGNVERIEARVPFEVANYLLNQKRTTIIDLEKQLGLEIAIIGRDDMRPGEIEVEQLKKERTATQAQDNAPVSHSNQIEFALAAVKNDEESASSEETTEIDEPDEASAIETSALEEAPSETPKKRKRRRRRKPSAKKEQTDANLAREEAGTEESAGSPSEVASEEQRVPGEQPASVDSPVSESEYNSETETAKPKSRNRRSRRKPRPNTEEAQPAESPVVSADTPSSTDPVQSIAAAPQPTANQGQPGPEAAATAAVLPVASQEPATPQEVAGTESRTEDSAEKKPAPKRPRRTSAAKKAAEKTETPAEAAPAEAAPAVAIPGSDKTEVPAAKRTRRPRAKAKENSATAELAAPTTDASAQPEQSSSTGQAAAAAPEQVEEKPKPARKPRKTAAQKAAEETAAQDQPEPGSETSDQQKSPAKPRRTRKPAAPKADTAGSDEGQKEAPKKRTRRTTKKAADTAAAPEEPT